MAHAVLLGTKTFDTGAALQQQFDHLAVAIVQCRAQR
jgi:hypothetical protein